MFIDAKGKACPMPVVMAKKELDAGCKDMTVAVDNATAVGNLTRLAEGKGMQVSATEQNGTFEVHIFGDSATPAEAAPVAVPLCSASGCGYAVFIGKDQVGDGDRELGYNLMKMAIYSLTQSEAVPASMLFMNSGVKLPAGEERQILDSLHELMDKGCEVLVCGTCLNFYGLTENLKVGQVSNML